MKYLVYDRTDGALSFAWARGAQLYRAQRRIDGAIGVTSWAEAFAWLERQPGPIDELQYWGHGRWGCALVDRTDILHAPSLEEGHAHHRGLAMIRERLGPDALIWFRTCETFGANLGLDFAPRIADFFGARAAGHTHVIGFHQSGLHGLAPGMAPDWAGDEGLAKGTPAEPVRAKRSAPWRTRTITCFAGHIPAAWFSTGYRGAVPA